MSGTLWLIAGPNGVGKTTYARRYLRSVAGTSAFVNLGEIGRDLSPLEPTPDARTQAAAARIALRRIGEGIASGASALRRLERAEALGMSYRDYTLEILERGRHL